MAAGVRATRQRAESQIHAAAVRDRRAVRAESAPSPNAASRPTVSSSGLSAADWSAIEERLEDGEYAGLQVLSVPRILVWILAGEPGEGSVEFVRYLMADVPEELVDSASAKGAGAKGATAKTGKIGGGRGRGLGARAGSGIRGGAGGPVGKSEAARAKPKAKARSRESESMQGRGTGKDRRKSLGRKRTKKEDGEEDDDEEEDEGDDGVERVAPRRAKTIKAVKAMVIDGGREEDDGGLEGTSSKEVEKAKIKAREKVCRAEWYSLKRLLYVNLQRIRQLCIDLLQQLFHLDSNRSDLQLALSCLTCATHFTHDLHLFEQTVLNVSWVGWHFKKYCEVKYGYLANFFFLPFLTSDYRSVIKTYLKSLFQISTLPDLDGDPPLNTTEDVEKNIIRIASADDSSASIGCPSSFGSSEADLLKLLRIAKQSNVDFAASPSAIIGEKIQVKEFKAAASASAGRVRPIRKEDRIEERMICCFPPSSSDSSGSTALRSRDDTLSLICLGSDSDWRFFVYDRLGICSPTNSDLKAHENFARAIQIVLNHFNIDAETFLNSIAVPSTSLCLPHKYTDPFLKQIENPIKVSRLLLQPSHDGAPAAVDVAEDRALRPELEAELDSWKATMRALDRNILCYSRLARNSLRLARVADLYKIL